MKKAFLEAFAANLGKHIGFIVATLIMIGFVVAAYYIWEDTIGEQERRWDESLTEFRKLRSNTVVAEAKPISEEEWRRLIKEAIDSTVLEYADETDKSIRDILRLMPKVPQNVIRWAPGDINKRWYSKKHKEWRAYTMKGLWTKPDADGEQISLGYAKFETEGSRIGQWTVGVLPFQIKANIARLQAETGEYTYAVEVVLVGPHNGPDKQRGKEWKIKLDKDNVKVAISPDQATLPPPEPKPEPRWHWWAPHVQANVGGGAYFYPGGIKGIGSFGVGFSPFGYGLTKNAQKMFMERH